MKHLVAPEEIKRRMIENLRKEGHKLTPEACDYRFFVVDGDDESGDSR
jgi:hypothetical protein